MQLRKTTGVDFTLVSFTLIISLLSLLFVSCENNQDSPYEKEIKSFRKEKRAAFLSDASPLDKEERTDFIGLNYYPIDSTFRVKAHFESIDSLDKSTFETNTDRAAEYLNLGTLSFTINDTLCTLSLYKSLDVTDSSLFLPFTDASNGISTYYSGRYIDIEQSQLGDTVLVDFNKSYNPYCAYSDRYSCPIPPRSNWLTVKITAGEKLYKKNH